MHLSIFDDTIFTSSKDRSICKLKLGSSAESTHLEMDEEENTGEEPEEEQHQGAGFRLPQNLLNRLLRHLNPE